jgi:hypothetical protein
MFASGDAMKGDDGTEGLQLTQSPTADGREQLTVAECVRGTTCSRLVSLAGGLGNWVSPDGQPGGTNACVGAPGFAAPEGGAGGTGGLWEPVYDGAALKYVWRLYKGSAAYQPGPGVSLSGAAGVDGTDGPNAPAVGAFSPEGYRPADGTAGTHGATGMGGAGGRGDTLLVDANASYVALTSVWRGYGGSGGGAGGCPGLAGTAGKGGGASVSLLLVESPITIEGTELVARAGGSGGRGALGAMPTPGGAGGPSSAIDSMPLSSGKAGGRGGAAGVSGNGGSGPSAAIAHIGAAPKLSGATKLSPGSGGTAIDEQTRTDALGITKTIPATPAGVSTDILAL